MVLSHPYHEYSVRVQQTQMVAKGVTLNDVGRRGLLRPSSVYKESLTFSPFASSLIPKVH